MRKLFLGLILFIHLSAISQNEENSKAFDSIINEVTINTSESDPIRAIHLADSLLLYSTSDQQKIQSIMLLAGIFDRQERREESIQQVHKALEIAETAKDYSMQARLYGFLSTQYRAIGFLDKGRAYLEKGIEISSKIEDKESASRYMGKANKELAVYAMDEDKYEEAIQYLELALLIHAQEKNKDSRNFQLATTEQILAKCYIALNQEDKALNHFRKANILINLSGNGNTLWACLIYRELGETYLIKDELDSAGIFLKRAMAISDNSSHGTLKEDVYNSIAKYYERIKEMDSFALYTAKHREILKENTIKKRHMTSREFTRLNIERENEANSNALYITLSVIGILILTGTTIYFIRNKFLQKNNNENDQENNEENESSNPLNISHETETMLLAKLEDFEGTNKYLDKNMSFSVLVSIMNTNAKYLSHILKNYKNKDYNTYINELRINYIIDKLRTNPEYLSYKISYLADESGFSSHSKFSADFKRVVDLSPSEFIESIKK